MAAPRICSVEACGNLMLARGLCNKHYIRWRKYGSPTHPFRKPRIEWIEEHADFGCDECLIWPFGRSAHGRGCLMFQGRQTTAPHIMCTLAHGERPSSGHAAAHSCGKGHEGCVNPRHLRWATAVENSADMKAHGTVVRGEKQHSARLTPDEVRKIRSLRGKVLQRELAGMFSVDITQISRIQRRLSWAHLE